MNSNNYNCRHPKPEVPIQSRSHNRLNRVRIIGVVVRFFVGVRSSPGLNLMKKGLSGEALLI